MDREYAPDPSQYERGHFDHQRYGGPTEGGGYVQGEAAALVPLVKLTEC